MKIFYQYMAIFLNFPPTSNHLHPVQVENCDSNSRLVVDEMTTFGKFRLERVKYFYFNERVNLSVIYKYGFKMVSMAICLEFRIAKLNNLNFYPLEVVSRCRNTQLWVRGNYSYLYNFKPNIYKSCCLNISLAITVIWSLAKILKTTVVVISGLTLSARARL